MACGSRTVIYLTQNRHRFWLKSVRCVVHYNGIGVRVVTHRIESCDIQSVVSSYKFCARSRSALTTLRHKTISEAVPHIHQNWPWPRIRGAIVPMQDMPLVFGARQCPFNIERRTCRECVAAVIHHSNIAIVTTAEQPLTLSFRVPTIKAIYPFAWQMDEARSPRPYVSVMHRKDSFRFGLSRCQYVIGADEARTPRVYEVCTCNENNKASAKQPSDGTQIENGLGCANHEFARRDIPRRSKNFNSASTCVFLFLLQTSSSVGHTSSLVCNAVEEFVTKTGAPLIIIIFSHHAICVGCVRCLPRESFIHTTHTMWHAAFLLNIISVCCAATIRMS